MFCRTKIDNGYREYTRQYDYDVLVIELIYIYT